MTSSGAPIAACPSADGSASSTGPTTRRRSWSGCTTELLERQRLPPSLVTKHIWEERFEDINAYERYLTRNGVIIRKFYLHVSRKEQKRRFLERLDEPEKNWKFAAADVRERDHWDEYMAAYEDMIRHTATPHAPWYVVPADYKWVTRLIVAAAAVDTLQGLKLRYPEVSDAKREELKTARAALEDENGRAEPATDEPVEKEGLERFDD